MMRKNLILGLLLVLPVLSYAQQDTVSMDTAMAKRWLNEAKDLIGKGKNDEAEGRLKGAREVFEKVLGKESVEYADVLHQMGRVWIGRRDYDQGIVFTQQALDIRLVLLGEENLAVAASYNNLGTAYESKKEYDKALEYKEKTLTLRLKLLGKEHLDVGASYYNLGAFFQSINKYDESILHYEKALSVFLKLLGEEHINVAATYYNLGSLYDPKGEYDKAIEYKEKSLKICLKILGQEHPNLINLYYNLGVSCYLKSDFTKAVVYHEKALNLRLKHLGEDHLDVATSYDNMGAISFVKYEYDQALKYHERALNIRLKLLGDKHLDIATSYYNLGLTNQFKGKYPQAIEYMEKALSLRLKLLGEKHQDVAAAYINLGSFHYSAAEYDQAIQYTRKAISLYQLLFRGKHQGIITAYNNLGLSFHSKDLYEDAIGHYEKALNLCLELLGGEHLEMANSYDNLGKTYLSKGEYDKAIKYHEQALAIRLKLFGEKHLDVANCYGNLGNAYQFKGEYKKSIKYYEKSLVLNLKLIGGEHPNIADVYNNLGIGYYAKGEYEKANIFYEKSLFINLKFLNEKHPSIANSYHNIGETFFFKTEYDKAIEYLEKALNLRLKIFGEEHSNIASSYNDIATVFLFKTNYDEAIKYHEKALLIRQKLWGEEHPAVASSYLNLGITYQKKGEYDKAIYYQEKALKIHLKIFDEEHVYVINDYNNLGITYDAKGQYERSITCYSSALKALKYNIQSPRNSNSLEGLFQALRLYGQALQKQYSIAPTPSALSQSLHYSQGALATIEYQSSIFTFESSKTYWQSNYYHPIYEQAIDISLLAADVNQNDTLRRQTFTYAEKSKATQLQAQLKNADALAFSGIPDSLTQKEYQLRIDLSWREKQRQGLLDQGKTETDSTVLRLSSILFDLRQQYDTLKSRFEKNYPDYYRLKYDLRTVPLDYVQDTLLQPGQTLLEYFVGDSSIYLFLVQPKNYEVIKIKKDTAFEHWVEDLTRNGIYGYYGKKGVSKGKSINNFGKAAYQLYETLIAPIKAKLPEKGKLIIIPDGILGYVPFEALLTEKPPRPDAIQEYKYLIQKHQISYCYSATLLKEMQNKKHRQEPTQKLLAMAPFFLGNADTLLSKVDSTELLADVVLRTRDTLTALPSSGPEVASISKIIPGQAFYGKAATLAQFQKLAAQARILHLSTHAEADNRLSDYAYLAFSMPNANGTFDKLYVRDLYNLSLNADLVVLSACETGIGKLQRGEGIVSLARAFAYAGAKSIVTTLWKVSDEQSKNLMTSFYKYLSKGKDKDEALRLAKLEFLQKNEKKTELLHPFFWASFIGIGDMRGLENSK